MHFDGGRKQIIHNNETNVFLVALVAKHPEELWQKCMRVLVQVHVVSGQKLLQKLRFLALHRLDDELVIVRQEEEASGSTRICQLSQGFKA